MAEKYVDFLGKFLKFGQKMTGYFIEKQIPSLKRGVLNAKVEMRRPNLADFDLSQKELVRLMHAAKAGQWKQVPLKEAFLNTLVTIEVLTWFFVGEIIGRFSFTGYNRIPGCYIQAPPMSYV
ncbi:unnamed protein product [Dicrocoelium dendriticum]|nr:unnamed protein product [Dicrocoelium dendriticum]